MTRRIRTIYFGGRNNAFGSKFQLISHEDRSVQQPKCQEYDNKDEKKNRPIDVNSYNTSWSKYTHILEFGS